MARPLRLEYAGANYHVISRGNNRSNIFYHPGDYKHFLQLLEKITNKFAVRIHAYCLMINHYHLLLETPLPNLRKAIQYLNGAYCIFFNRKHHRTGHVMQGRYKSILIEKDSYLLELSRYIHLNPVRAGIVRTPSAYPWSSYNFYRASQGAPSWLMVDDVLDHFGISNSANAAYRTFVEDKLEEKIKENPLQGTVLQCLLGGRTFVERMKEKAGAPTPEVCHHNSFTALLPEQIENTLEGLKMPQPLKNTLLIYFLYRYTDMRLREICELFKGGHYSRISHTIRRLERQIATDHDLNKVVQSLNVKLSTFKG